VENTPDLLPSQRNLKVSAAGSLRWQLFGSTNPSLCRVLMMIGMYGGL
jgi:hypothetical protein